MDETKENFITRICPFCKALMKNKVDSYEEKMRRITNVSRCAICGELFKEEKAIK